ncbi:hypothetical protein [Thiomicrorhabdus indica]|uniref:hypothetical protein n=1 Tax=Thiomicrorhabdus indica TaxID=2267253 RepID=UPI00102D9731|nr:hypothetical protein [Thiomicrorhabdus indica]
MFNKSVLFLIPLILATNASQAQESMDVSKPSIADIELKRLMHQLDMETLNQENSKLNAKISKIDIQKRLEEKLFGVLPTVLSIVGVDGKFQARLSYQNGSQRIVSLNGVVNPGVKISNITPTSVEVSAGGKVTLLPMNANTANPMTMR